METNFITKHIPEKILNKIEKSLLWVVGEKDGRSRFQRAYDWFAKIKPNEKLVTTIIDIAKYVLKIPGITEALLVAYNKAAAYQFLINANEMSPEEAGNKLREQLKKDLDSDKLVDFIFGCVMIALKILNRS